MPQSDKNKKILFLTGFLLCISTGLLVVMFHLVIHRNVMVKARETVSNLIQTQMAIRQYVMNSMRAEIYRLEQKGLLQAGYFAPELMSRSFVSSEIIKIFLSLQKHGLDSSVFRYASKSPLNIENRATSHEEKLLELFEQNEITEYSEEIIQNGKKVLFYAVPLDRFNSSCMSCHSDPAIAPHSLTERYGTSHGFFQQEGELSGLMSIEIPLEHFNKQCIKTTIFVTTLTVIGFTIIFFLIRHLIVKKDIHDMLLEKHNKELDRLSTTDPLTGLHNRLRFNQEIAKIELSPQEYRKNVALFVLDIDHFKSVNDVHGHSIGDEVLISFGAFLTRMSRKTDFIARLGGEEFVVLVSGMEKGELQQYAQRLLDEMLKVFYPEGVSITASIGIAILKPEEGGKSFFSRADKAMYQAKQNGRYCYTMAD